MMKTTFFQYKHYIFILLALLIANYLVVPLNEYYKEQQTNLFLLNKQYQKTQFLLKNEKNIKNNAVVLQTQTNELFQYIFTQSSEAEFKLVLQKKLEVIFTNAKCSIERIDFKGSNMLLENFESWSIEMRYSGDVLCLSKVTRGIESLIPYVNVSQYTYYNNGFDKTAKSKFDVMMIINTIHKKVVSKGAK